MNRRRGFTIIELMVALVVVAILAVVAAPEFGEYFAAQRVKSAAEELLTDLQFARLESVQKNADITLTMNSSGYTITRGAATVKTVTLGSGTTVSAGSTMSAVFNAVRATANVNNGPVTIANGGTSRTLRVGVNTMGRVTICSPSGSFKGYDAC